MAKSTLPSSSKSIKICSVESCAKKQKTRGWCLMHYARWRKSGNPLIVSVIVGDHITRFWSKVNKTDSCWIWTSTADEDGYGRFCIKRKRIGAHRYSYFLANGRYPEPNCLHSCDNPPCVNPDHLHEGTMKDNAQERSERGRNKDYKGEKCHWAKLTTSDVVEIKKLISQKVRIKTISELFGVKPSTITAIKRGANWAHL